MPILIVIADSSVQRQVEHVLAQQDWQVVAANDGESAFAQIQQQTPDAVVCGLDLPGMSGHELIGALSEHFPHVPAVVLSQEGSEKEVIECFRAGAADYVTMAELQQELPAVIQKLVDEEEQAACVPPCRPRDSDAAVVAEPAPEAVPAEPSDSQDDQSSTTEQPSLDDYYEVRSWQSEDRERSVAEEFDQAGMRISSNRLRVLHRQMDRLFKWASLGTVEHDERRRHPRGRLGRIVKMYPLDQQGKPKVANGFESFCKDISAGGCGLLHGRSFTRKQWIVTITTKGNATLAALRCEIVRQRPLPLGMYEIGMRFLERVEIPE